MKKNGKAYAAVRAAFSAALSCVLVLSLVGCKDTDVLTQVIIDQSAPVDNSLEPITDNDATSPLQESWAEKQYDSDNDQNKSQSQDNTPTYDSQTPNDSQAQQKQQNDLSLNDGKATEGAGESAEGGQGGSGAAASDEGSTAEEEDQSKANSYVQKAETDSTSDSGNSGTDNISGSDPSGYNGSGSGQGSGGTGQVYGSDGTYVNLPYAGSIAAAGEYATIVQMLGGKNALAATDSEWLSRMRSKGAFSTNGDELSNVQVAWSGDGRASGSADVAAIVASGAKVVLTCDETYGGITQDQANQLMEKGVSVVVMPAVGTAYAGDDEILQSVQIVGEILSKAGSSIQYNAKDAANKYKSFHTETLNNVVSANGGYSLYTHDNSTYPQVLYTGRGAEASNFSSSFYIASYVDRWLNCDTYQSGSYRYVDGSEGIGVGVAGRWTNPRHYYAVYLYYLQSAGVMSTITRINPYYYFGSDYFEGCGARDVSGLGAGQLFWCFGNPGLTRSEYALVGENKYPAILVRDSDIAEHIKRSAETPQDADVHDNLYYNNITPYNAALAEKCPMNSYVCVYLSSYQIWVVPSGITGSWTDGTVESFLLAPWTYCMYQQEQRLDVCSSYVSNFYSTFFRCDPSSAVEGYGETYVANCHS